MDIQENLIPQQICIKCAPYLQQKVIIEHYIWCSFDADVDHQIHPKAPLEDAILE